MKCDVCGKIPMYGSNVSHSKRHTNRRWLANIHPATVTVNGKAAPVINALGWPGMTNAYRVDFRVPDGTSAGMATLGLSVAWINGPEVKIPVR